MTVAAFEWHVEQLIGRRVLARNGRSIGHIEEIVAVREHGDWFVEEYHVGSRALLERLAVRMLGPPRLRAWGFPHSGYRIPWSKLDLAEMTRPRLTCSVQELLPLD
jgi:hypothetical protein